MSAKDELTESGAKEYFNHLMNLQNAIYFIETHLGEICNDEEYNEVCDWLASSNRFTENQINEFKLV